VLTHLTLVGAVVFLNATAPIRDRGCTAHESTPRLRGSLAEYLFTWIWSVYRLLEMSRLLLSPLSCSCESIYIGVRRLADAPRNHMRRFR